MKYYPITRHRDYIDAEYVQREVDRGVKPYDSYKDADAALDWMDTDDSDYGVFAHNGVCWCYVREDNGNLKPL